MPQLKNVYSGRWESFISNSGVKQFFNVNDVATADFVSEYLGKETLYTMSESVTAQGQGSSYAATGRPLLTSDEVRRLGKDEQILFYERQKPIRAAKLCYYRDAEFKDRAGADPYVVKSR